jgi:hypothetical protein
MNPTRIFILLSVLLLTGCISNASPAQVDATPTTEAIATRTPSPVPSATPTPTITLTPTATATSTITLTPTPDIEAMIRNLVSEFNLDPQRQYELLTSEGRQYLVDTFNQAKMAKLEGGSWVDTTTEEKYGHLVPEGVTTRINTPVYGKMFEHPDSTQGISLRDIQKYDYLTFIAWSTGNMNFVEEYDEDLGQEVIKIYGTIVFPDHEGKLMEMKVRYDVVDPGYRVQTYTCNWEGDVDFSKGSPLTLCPAYNSLPPLDTVEEFIEVHSKPGQMIDVGYVTQRPNEPPLVYKSDWSKINNRACHYSWHRDKKFYNNFTDFLLNEGDIEIPENYIFASSTVSLFMTIEEILPYWEE